MPALCRASTLFLEPSTWTAGTSPAMTQQISLHSRHIEFRLLAAAVAAQRALLADRVGALEDPVLPRGQPRKDFRFHRLWPGEAQACVHAGEAVEREACALLEEHADLVVPVDIVEREGDEPEFLRRLGIERLADARLDMVDVGRI